MRKTLITFTAFLLLFAGISGVKADTLYRTSNKNGEVNLSILTNQGYVGALDMTITISGKVKLTSLNWSSTLSSKYIKKYTYKNNQVRVYIATGDSSKNLAKENGEIQIGTLKVTSKTNNNEEFNINIDKLIATDIDYNSVTKTDLKIDGNDSFTYKITPTGGTEKKETKTNQSNTKSNTAPSNQNSREENNQSFENNKINENNKKDDSESSTETKKEVKEEKKNNNIIIIVILIASVIGGNIIGVVIYRNRKK